VTDPSPYPWNTVDAHLRRVVPASVYDEWLSHLRLVHTEGTRLVVTAPDSVRAWVGQRFARTLRAAAQEALGPGATVELVAPGDTPDGGHVAGAGPDEPALNPKYAFEHFVIGDSNRLAHAAALSVAETPGHSYNPLFIYGPPGVGKTHLLHSIGAYVLAYGGGLTVRYTTVEEFTNAFLAALHGGDIDAFKLRFRRVDVLLIDDIQFLEAKVKTEEEFFHTFNALYETGSQIVVTSDRLPRDLDALHERLRERFEAGLVTDIGPPDLQVRLAVLRKRAQYDDIELEDGDAVLDLIAQRITTNIRALEGALVRVVAYASLIGRTADPALAAEVLDRLYPPGAGGAPDPLQRTGGPISVAHIQALVAQAFALTTDDLLGHDRSARVVWPRQLAMYLARETTGATFPALGRAFGNRNHTTVINACQRVGKRIASDPDAADTVRSLTDRLGMHSPDRDA
jgi:chromosomal replication initiator protein